MTTDQWGIEEGYADVGGGWHPASAATVAALRASMGAIPDDQDSPPPPAPGLRIVRFGDESSVDDPGELTLEDGSQVKVQGRLPPDLPLGYHDLRSVAGQETRLVVAPARCYLPADLHAWGLAVQLYAARSRSSWRKACGVAAP